MNMSVLAAKPDPLTQQGSIVGTFQFMAPEVLQGQEADARSDIFSFGCVLYEMITGKRAFEGKTGQLGGGDPRKRAGADPRSAAHGAGGTRSCFAGMPGERTGSALAECGGHWAGVALDCDPVARERNAGSAAPGSSKAKWLERGLWAAIGRAFAGWQCYG